MTRDEVIRLAREAGFWGADIRHNDDGSLERFAAMVAAAARAAIQAVLWDYAEHKDLTNDDRSLLAHLHSLIRAGDP